MTIDPAELAAQRFKEGGLYCTEAVLLSLAEHRGATSDLIPKIASGLTAGMGRCSQTCGAVTGAIMGLGLALGRSRADESLEPIFKATQQLIGRFEDKYGSANCAGLIQCDLNTPEGQRCYHENNLWDQCAVYIQGATEIALDLLPED